MPSAGLSEGGERITIMVNGFTPDTQVWLDDQPGTMVTVHSLSKLALLFQKRTIATKWGRKRKDSKRSALTKSQSEWILFLTFQALQIFLKLCFKIVLQRNVANLEVVDINGDPYPISLPFCSKWRILCKLRQWQRLYLNSYIFNEVPLVVVISSWLILAQMSPRSHFPANGILS